jgi:hypothetical protein
MLGPRVRPTRHRIGIILGLISGCFIVSSPLEHLKGSSLAAVQLAILQDIWNEPASYAGSGSDIPDEFRSRFHTLINGSNIDLLSDLSGCAMRAKVLEHVSRRTFTLVDSLPLDLVWEASLIGTFFSFSMKLLQ